jgi:hypothetical protein
MDSLMAVELKNRLEATLGVTLPSTLAYEHPNIAGLAEFICGEVLAVGAAETAPTEGEIDPSRAAQLLDNLSDLPDDQVEVLLEKMAAEQNESREEGS